MDYWHWKKATRVNSDTSSSNSNSVQMEKWDMQITQTTKTIQWSERKLTSTDAFFQNWSALLKIRKFWRKTTTCGPVQIVLDVKSLKLSLEKTIFHSQPQKLDHSLMSTNVKIQKASEHSTTLFRIWNVWYFRSLVSTSKSSPSKMTNSKSNTQYCNFGLTALRILLCFILEQKPMFGPLYVVRTSSHAHYQNISSCHSDLKWPWLNLEHRPHFQKKRLVSSASSWRSCFDCEC